jgi:hypothetical protein
VLLKPQMCIPGADYQGDKPSPEIVAKHTLHVMRRCATVTSMPCDLSTPGQLAPVAELMLICGRPGLCRRQFLASCSCLAGNLRRRQPSTSMHLITLHCKEGARRGLCHSPLAGHCRHTPTPPARHDSRW